jgi:hypothetical protein
MMTRKDYIKIAEILNSYHLDIDSQVFEDLLSDFQTFFKRDNSNFDLTRFRDAVMK